MEGIDELEPTRESALVDLLDRILVKGVILHADVIISVADIPLIGVNLRAAIAGIKTMLDYGMMEAWDAKIRRYALEHDDEEGLTLFPDETLVYKSFASHWYKDTSLPGTWRKGYLYLTNNRLVLIRKKPMTTLFEVPLRKVRNLSSIADMHLGKRRKMLLLSFENEASEMEEAKLLTDSRDVGMITLFMLITSVSRYTVENGVSMIFTSSL